jgi:hypothetical protein
VIKDDALLTVFLQAAMIAQYFQNLAFIAIMYTPPNEEGGGGCMVCGVKIT